MAIATSYGKMGREGAREKVADRILFCVARAVSVLRSSASA